MKRARGSNIPPLQKLSLKHKGVEWREHNVDYFISKFDIGHTQGKTRKDRMKTAYDLYNSIFDESDLKYVTDPFKVRDGFPAALQNFNIIKPKIDLLIGEETKRPFNYKVIQVNDAAITKLQEKYRQLLTEAIVNIAAQGNPEDPVTDEELAEVDALVDYMQYSYSDIAEKVAYHTLEYLKEKEDLQSKFSWGFKDGLIGGMEVYYVGIINGEPVLERVNPIYFSYDTSPEVHFTEKGDYAVRRMRMSIAAIYDRLYDIMDESTLNELIDRYDNSAKGGASSKEGDFNKIVWKNFNPNEGKEELSTEAVDVWHVTWKSFTKVGFLTYFDEDGEEQKDIVSEDYEATEDEDIYWDWVTEIWEGYRIGDDIYVGINPIPNQQISVDNPNSQDLPYIGAIYNDDNTRGKSLVEIMKPLQYMYLIIWYRLEVALARDKGRVINMDITQIPKSMGVSTEQWMHYLSSMGVNFFNPYEEGWDIPGREGGKPAQFNQFSSQDLTMSNVIRDHIELMNKVEEMVGELSGVSRQRQGQVQTSELVGNVERAVIQSSHITEIHFWIHNRIKKRVLQSLLEAAKQAWGESGKQKLHYITDDVTRIFLDITDDFLYADFGIFATDSSQEAANLEAVKSLLQPAMQNGASLADVADVIASNNLTEIRHKLKKIEQERMEREQQMQESQMEMQQQMEELRAQEQELDRELKRYEIDANNEVKLLIAEMQHGDKELSTLINEEGTYTQGNIKERELSIKEEIENRKLDIEKKKIEMQKELQRMKDEAAYKREKIKASNKPTSTKK